MISEHKRHRYYRVLVERLCIAWNARTNSAAALADVQRREAADAIKVLVKENAYLALRVQELNAMLIGVCDD